MLASYLVFDFFNYPAFWVVAATIALVAFFSGRYLQNRESRVKFLIEQANLKTRQIAELEKINKELETKNRDLYSKDLALTMANKRLQSLEEAKSKFVSVTTHQLRTPLAAIKWIFDLAAKGQLGVVSDDFKKSMEQGLISTNRVITIVNDLLKVDSIEEEQVDYKFQPADLSKLLEETLQEFTSQARMKKIELALEKPKTPIPFIDMDYNKIRMVIENLIDNAIKYTPQDGRVTIKLSDERLNTAEGAVQISVADSGIGIPSADTSKIFQKFFRAGNAIKAEPNGSGLGLFIARDIIEKHNGTIWFENKPAGGAAFSFTLPLHQKKV